MPKARSSVANVISAPIAPTFSTAFPTIENPVSVAGRLVNLGATANGFTKLQTTAAGKCVGTNTGSTFDDSYAHLTGWDGFPNQWIQCTAGLAAGLPNDGNSREIELHLRGNSDTSSGYKIYEIDFQYNTTGVPLVRWDGASGSFTVAAGAFTLNTLPADGDVYYAQIVGNIITVKQNGVSCGTVNVATDANIGGTVYSSGNPGMGAFIRPGANNADYYFKALSAGAL